MNIELHLCSAISPLANKVEELSLGFIHHDNCRRRRCLWLINFQMMMVVSTEENVYKIKFARVERGNFYRNIEKKFSSRRKIPQDMIMIQLIFMMAVDWVPLNFLRNDIIVVVESNQWPWRWAKSGRHTHVTQKKFLEIENWFPSSTSFIYVAGRWD